MLDINGALKAIGYGLLVLFFAVGVVKTCSSFADLKRPEAAFKIFIRFVLAKAAVGYGLDLMLAVFGIIQGMVATIISQSGLSGSSGATLPQEIIDKINTVGFWDSIPLWAVTLLGSLFITVLAFIMILTVYSRMFKLYMRIPAALRPESRRCLRIPGLARNAKPSPDFWIRFSFGQLLISAAVLGDQPLGYGQNILVFRKLLLLCLAEFQQHIPRDIVL